MESSINPTFNFTSEAFGEGNSDKICDYIADSIVDFVLDYDPNALVSVDVLSKSNLVTIVGEIKSPA